MYKSKRFRMAILAVKIVDVFLTMECFQPKEKEQPKRKKRPIPPFDIDSI